MELKLDLDQKYGLVLEGGGAKGAYQIGAWKALREAGVQIEAVAGTSVGALNGALICMDRLEEAEQIWKTISYSSVMDVDDNRMEQLFQGKLKVTEAVKEVMGFFNEGGKDITPLKNLIGEYISEEEIRKSETAFYLLTFSISMMRELDIDVKELPEGLLADFLLASAYLPVFKKEKLHGKKFMDGGMFNNVPLESLVKRGYQNIIVIRIFGIGREKKVKIPENTKIYQIEPRVNLGNILEFESKKSIRNMKIGYYDALRFLYGLKGKIYYIEENEKECYYLNQLVSVSDEVKKALMAVYEAEAEASFSERVYLEKVLHAVAEELKLPKGWDYRELYLSMLEAAAKLLKIQKYAVYQVEELRCLVRARELEKQTELPAFASIILNKIVTREEIKNELKRT